MKAVLAWVKSNLLIVIFGVVALVLPIGGFVGASMWNASIVEQAEARYQEESRKLDQAAEVTYVIPPIAEGEEAITRRRPPNPVVTEFFAEQRAARQSEIERVIERGVRFNKGERGVLVRGLFPQAESEDAGRRLARELAEQIVGVEGRPSVYASLFRGINAGGPPDPERIAQRVIDLNISERERLVGESGEIGEEDREALEDALLAARLGPIVARSQELSVYGTPEVLRLGEEELAGLAEPYQPLPAEVPAVVTPSRAFAYQLDYWMVADILAAIGRANTEGGLPTEIPDSTVKRIVSLRLAHPPFPLDSQETAAPGGPGVPGAFPSAPSGQPRGRQPGGARGFPGGGGPSGPGGPGGPGGSQAAGEIPGQRETHTQRRTSKDNTVYDVRHATLVAVVASERLHRLLDAIQENNFMTVTGVSLEAVDIAEALERGYAYGESDHVVRATIDIETVWLRFWTAEAMPPEIREFLGVVLPAADENAPQG